MQLDAYLASLDHFHALASGASDRVVAHWLRSESEQQIAANGYRLLSGKALADRLDAAPHGETSAVLEAWVARSDRGSSTWSERARVARKVFALLEKHAEISNRLEISKVLDCPFKDVLPRVEAALGIEAPDADPDPRGPWRLVATMLAKVVSVVGVDAASREKLVEMLLAMVDQLRGELAEDAGGVEPVEDPPTLSESQPVDVSVAGPVIEDAHRVPDDRGGGRASIEGLETDAGDARRGRRRRR